MAKWSSELHVGLKEVFLFGTEAHVSGKLRRWAGRIKKGGQKGEKGGHETAVRTKGNLDVWSPSWLSTQNTKQKNDVMSSN